MKNVDFLIIGGSAAGTTAAGVIRSLRPEDAIAIVCEEPYEFYSRVLIPHYIRHRVSREQVFLKKPQWYEEKKIEFIKGVRVENLDCQKKEVKLSSGDTINFGKLLITVGGKVIPFDAPGVNLENIFYMRTIDDADKIIAAASKAKSGIIIGGGFIGLEFASCFQANGVLDIKILVMEPYFWQGKLDEASSKVLTNTLERSGIKILTNEEVAEFRGSTPNRGRTPAVTEVVTKLGKTFAADVVGIGIGIKPDIEWLKKSGVNTNRGILTNEYLETNIADIYAAGDCAEFKDVVFDRQHILGNWANATNQGSAVGKTMAGEKTVFETVSSYSISFFDGSCSFIGETDEKFADEIISRGSVESGKMTQIYIKTIGGVMRFIGATVINNVSEVPVLANIIRGKTDISSYKEKFSNINFNLNEVLK